MSFAEHLRELQRRLWTSVAAVVLCSIAAFVFYQEIFDLIRLPAEQVNQAFKDDPDWLAFKHKNGLRAEQQIIPLVAPSLLSPLVLMMWLVVIAGAVLSSPLWLYELWAFVAPGLRPQERWAIRPVLLGGLCCFLGGAAFCWFCVLPFTLRFCAWFSLTLGVLPWYTLDDYVLLLLTMLVIFGLVFEAPVVAAVLARLGLLKPRLFAAYWRPTVLGCFILGALLSPGQDPLSMLILSGALLVLWGLSWILTVVFSRRRNAD
jgi:sec-independent protein translocase protein TatC